MIELYDWFNNVCSSEGNFNDENIEFSSYIINDHLLKIYRKQHETTCVDYDKCINDVNCYEETLKEIYNDCNVFTFSGIKSYLDGIYKSFTESPLKVYCLKKRKLKQLLLNNPPYKTIAFLKCNCVSEILDNNIILIMALTRVLEEEEWLDKMYTLYKELKSEDFEFRDIEIIILPYERTLLKKLDKKNPIWEDKISGSIFSLPIRHDTIVPYCRIFVRFIHYMYELDLHSNFVYYLKDDTRFGEIFYNYISEKFFAKDFFEPHSIFESYIWNKTENYFYNWLNSSFDFEHFENNLSFETENNKIISSNNIFDIISNLSNNRTNDPKFRITSMMIKKELYEIYLGKKIDVKIILDSLYNGYLRK